MNGLYIVGAVVIAILLYSVSLYNWLQTAQTRIIASIQDIGNQLKRQANLIPNLESAAKGYLKHEKGIYDAIVSARKAVESATKGKDLAKIETASDAVSDLVPRLQVLIESNPELKGEAVISRLMDELRDTSDKLMYARRVVIDLTADFNQRLVTFPSNLVASAFGFKKQKGLETALEGSHLAVSDKEMEDPKVSL
jgi:LemA protein